MRRTTAELLGYRVVVTSAAPATTEIKALSGRGADVRHVALVGSDTRRAESELQRGLARLCTQQGRRPLVAFSTGLAIASWYRSAAALGIMLELRSVLRDAEVVTTMAAAPVARRFGLEPSEVVWPRDAPSVARAIASRRPGTVFLARHTTAVSRPAQELTRRGWEVIDLPVPVATFAPDVACDAAVEQLAAAIARRQVDVVSLTSAAGVDRLMRQADTMGLSDAIGAATRAHVSVAASNPLVAGVARLAGLTVHQAATNDRVGARVASVVRAVVQRRRLLCADPVTVVVQGGIVIVAGTALSMSAEARRVVEALAEERGGPVPAASLVRAAVGGEFHPSAGTDALARAVAEAEECLASAGAAIVRTDAGFALDRSHR